MKLKVNLISGGRYYKAGEDIPEDELPDFASRYASDVDDGNAVDESYAETLHRQRAQLRSLKGTWATQLSSVLR